LRRAPIPNPGPVPNLWVIADSSQNLLAQLDGIHSVPSFVIGKHLLSDGQPPEYFTEVLQAAAAKAGSV
jgi:hypothetical protein